MTTTTEQEPDVAPATTDAEETPRRSFKEWAADLSRRDRILIGAGAIVAVLVFVGVSMLTGGGEPAPSEDPTPAKPIVPEPLQKPDAQLTPSEYLELGRGAIREGRFTEARRHLERALTQRPVDTHLRAELCQRMADVCHRLNQPDAAALYREEAATLMSGLDGTALAVFKIAEADLAAGNVRAARRRYHLIALGGGHDQVADRKLRAEAERRLAKTYEAEFLKSRPAALDVIGDPPVFIEGARR